MRLAIIGDIHDLWNEADREFFTDGSWQALLFVGDLCGFTSSNTVLERLADLAQANPQLPVILFPGNHDATPLFYLLGEVKQNKALLKRYAPKHRERRKQWDALAGRIFISSYNHYVIEHEGLKLGIVGGRPHSMGGVDLSFREYLQEQYSISSIQESAQRIIAAAELCPAENIVFLAHNGPAGLGAGPGDIWGCDFNPVLGDFGDPDLALAIHEVSQAGQKTVHGVFAGHMHHKLKTGGIRNMTVDEAGILYSNAARVPRIFRKGGSRYHHFIEAVFDGTSIQAEHCKFSEKTFTVTPYEFG